MKKPELLLAGLFGCLTLSAAAPVLADDEPAQWESGEQVYQKVCGHCHEAGIGPVIKGRSLPPAYIETIVRHGFRAMPAIRASFIDDPSLNAVAEYVSKSAADTGEYGD